MFESGSILLYLAEKFGHFLPTTPAARTECLNWLFRQMGSAPLLGGVVIYAYADEKLEYPINRFTMEIKRQLDVLDKQLANHEFVAGTNTASQIWPYFRGTVLWFATKFMSLPSLFKRTPIKTCSWAEQLSQRPAVKRGRMVNKTWGEPEEQLHERHSAEDFKTKTQDKIG